MDTIANHMIKTDKGRSNIYMRRLLKDIS